MRSLEVICGTVLLFIYSKTANPISPLHFLLWQPLPANIVRNKCTHARRNPKVTLCIFLSCQSLSRRKGDQFRHVVHLQLPHRHHHAGPHLALAALPLPRLQVSVCFCVCVCVCYIVHIFQIVTYCVIVLEILSLSTHDNPTVCASLSRDAFWCPVAAGFGKNSVRQVTVWLMSCFFVLCVCVCVFSPGYTCSWSKKRKTRREMMSEKRIHEEYTKLGPIRCVHMFLCCVCVCVSDDRIFLVLFVQMLVIFSPTTVESTK